MRRYNYCCHVIHHERTVFQRQSSTPLRVMIALLMVVVVTITGCSGTIVDQIESLRGTRTEELRDQVRNDRERQSLLVFVHGFNSSKDSAWGSFPDLLMKDPDFADFNIHRFGYPTNRCRQVSDIRNQGEFLASYLSSILAGEHPRYRQIALVGHSMGGLVILHALLKLERDNYPMLKKTDLKVLTFGTPFLGVQNTESLLLICSNRQVNDMTALNDTLGELGREWTQRFNQGAGQGMRDTPQVPLYAFRGTEDRFVSAISACGHTLSSCESVDGDHNSIVKPSNPNHLAYQKLKQVVTRGRVSATPKGKVGIWVAKLTGDDPSFAAQRSIARSLEFFISREEAQLQDIVEVRELPGEITGSSFKEKENEVRRLAQAQHASIVVWGDITKLAGVEQFHSRVTLVRPLYIPSPATALLAPLTQAADRQHVSSPPETVSVTPDSIKEPLQLARFLVAVTFMEQRRWPEAAAQLEKFIGSGSAITVTPADAYVYAGFAYYSMSTYSGVAKFLSKAIDLYEKAIAGYIKNNDWDRSALVYNNISLIHLALVRRGIGPEVNLARTVEVLKEAQHLCEKQSNPNVYAFVLNNLGLTHYILAERGQSLDVNVRESIDSLTRAMGLFQEQENWAGYAVSQTNIGLTYQLMAQRGMEPAENLSRSVVALTEAVRIAKAQNTGAEYPTALNNLSLAFLALAERGIEPEPNLNRSVDTLKEASRFSKTHEDIPTYALVQANLGMVYLHEAQRGRATQQNLHRSIESLTEAMSLFKDQENWADYAVILSNLGLTYQTAAEAGLEVKTNIVRSIDAFAEAAKLLMGQRNMAAYAIVQTSHGGALRIQADYGWGTEESLGQSVRLLLEAAELFKQQSDEGNYAGAQNQLGMVFQALANRGIESEANFSKSEAALLEAARLFEKQGNLANYAVARSNLGLTHQSLALYGIESEANFKQSAEALEEAANLWKKLGSWADYALANNNLGVLYRHMTVFQISPEENFSRSLKALTEAAQVHPNAENWPRYADVQKNLGMTYRLGAMQGIMPQKNLRHSVKPLMDASALFKKQGNMISYAMAKNELALSCISLALDKEAAEENLALATEALEESARILEKESKLTDYALVKGNLGVAYRILAEQQVSPDATLVRSAETLNDALLLLKEQSVWDKYAEFLVELGRTHESSVARGMTDRIHEQAARAAYEEAVSVCRERSIRGDLVDAASSRLKVLKRD